MPSLRKPSLAKARDTGRAHRPAGVPALPARRPAGPADGLPASCAATMRGPAGRLAMHSKQPFWVEGGFRAGRLERICALHRWPGNSLLCPISHSAWVHGVQPRPSSVLAFIDVPLVATAEHLSFRHVSSVRSLVQGADLFFMW